MRLHDVTEKNKYSMVTRLGSHRRRDRLEIVAEQREGLLNRKKDELELDRRELLE